MATENHNQENATEARLRQLISHQIGRRLSILYPLEPEPISGNVEEALRKCIEAVQRKAQN
jgi:hypothetical protein